MQGGVFSAGSGSHAGAFGLGGAKYCDLGRGAREANVDNGDSGGPQFGADGRIVSVTSFGVTFIGDFGEIDGGTLNGTFGEFSGYLPLYIHADFLAAAVPEPATWAMLVAGFGLAGAGLRRRGRPLATA